MAATYRNLTSEELHELEKEFIEFLVVNGIHADDWVKMKEESKEEVDRIIELFSDVIFEGIMRKTRFLEFRTRFDIKTFQCLEDKIILMGIKGPDEVDFNDPVKLDQYMKKPVEGIEIYTQEKAYGKKRELEIFDMTNQGCYISDGQLFKALSLAYYDNQ